MSANLDYETIMTDLDEVGFHMVPSVIPEEKSRRSTQYSNSNPSRRRHARPVGRVGKPVRIGAPSHVRHPARTEKCWDNLDKEKYVKT